MAAFTSPTPSRSGSAEKKAYSGYWLWRYRGRESSKELIRHLLGDAVDEPTAELCDLAADVGFDV